jgi:hypothetical protein
MEVSGQLLDPAALPPGKEPFDTHWAGGWVEPRACLDTVVKRKIPSPCQESNTKPGLVHHRLVAVLTEISRLLFKIIFPYDITLKLSCN